MPIIRGIPPDPADQVIAGEQLRIDSIVESVDSEAAPLIVVNDLTAGGLRAGGLTTIVPGEINYGWLSGGEPEPTREVLRNPFVGQSVRNNAMISTPTGALVIFPIGQHLMLDYMGATNQWSVVGQTVNGSGAALGGCRVVVLETGRIAVTGSPVVAEVISDGSGNFSIPVPLNTAYELTAYLPGSPDKAGITRQDVVPTAASTLIYLRDPTAADVGGSASYRVIGSAVVRRLDR